VKNWILQRVISPFQKPKICIKFVHIDHTETEKRSGGVIKGISRQILEITDTKNAYFERALLVVRPDRTDCPTTRLQQEARELLNAEAAYTGLRRARLKHTLSRIGFLLLGGGIGALFATVIFH
jgi:hypothetical protein